MIAKRSIGACQLPALYRDENNLVLPPHPLLRPAIANYTFSCPLDMPAGQVVLPSASTTLVYAIGDCAVRGGLRGVNTRPVQIAGFSRRFAFLVLVEFHSAGLYQFAGGDQSELLNCSFAAADINGQIDRKILETLYQYDDIAAIRDQPDCIFLSRFSPGGLPPAVNRAMIRAGHGQIPCRQIAGEVHYSERQLSRLFRRCVGTGVKEFCRVTRMQYALDLLKKTPFEYRIWPIWPDTTIWPTWCAIWRRRVVLRRLNTATICRFFYNDPHKITGYNQGEK